MTRHAGQNRLLLSLTHVAEDRIKAMTVNIRKGHDHVLASAPQLPKPDRWPALVRYIVEKILAAKSKSAPHIGFTLPPSRHRNGVTEEDSIMGEIQVFFYVPRRGEDRFGLASLRGPTGVPMAVRLSHAKPVSYTAWYKSPKPRTCVRSTPCRQHCLA